MRLLHAAVAFHACRACGRLRRGLLSRGLGATDGSLGLALLWQVEFSEQPRAALPSNRIAADITREVFAELNFRMSRVF